MDDGLAITLQEAYFISKNYNYKLATYAAADHSDPDAEFIFYIIRGWIESVNYQTDQLSDVVGWLREFLMIDHRFDGRGPGLRFLLSSQVTDDVLLDTLEELDYRFYLDYFVGCLPENSLSEFKLKYLSD